MEPHQEEGTPCWIPANVPTLARSSLLGARCDVCASHPMNKITTGMHPDQRRGVAPRARTPSSRATQRRPQLAWLAATMLSLAACSTSPPNLSMPAVPEVPPQDSWLSSLADKALTMTGFKAPEVPAIPEAPQVPDNALPDRRIPLHVHASTSLNVSDDGQPLGLVLRLYRLRTAESFQAAPADTFGDPAKEKQILGDALVSAREVLIKPGQHFDSVDKFGREARYLGVVGLFRKPADGRWRQVFDARQLELSGLTLGAHACALSVQVGQPMGPDTNIAKWSGAACPR